MDAASWTSSLELETPAGRMLRQLASLLPQGREFQITVFGSAPLQIAVDPNLTSADVDVFSDFEELNEIVLRAGLGTNQADFYIQVSSELNFRTSPRWKDRTQSARIGNCTFIFPHPIDILIAKLNRLDEKDLRAFRAVIAKTGHPTETELIKELQLAVDLFRPSFDEEQGHDMANNCRRLWPLIYGREIDPRAEIIAPALKIRREGYGEPVRDYKQELRDALKE
ncbi:MAG TPA: DUF6036 family nucleotidyltransferase [Methylomirabilota bacterium]|nr:DUF6036 family nucleotidyltransferase [Methylomirabilota bacterium]